MAENSAIEWTDHTFNAWEGCTKVAAGCANCYAEARAERFGSVKWGPKGTRRVASESYWRQPVKWNREAEKAGVCRRVFCASLADVFEDWNGPMHRSGQRLFWSHTPYGDKWHWIGEDDTAGGEDLVSMDSVRNRLFDLIDQTPSLDWLLLTKRPENIRRMWDLGRGRPNVWLMTSVATQEDADRNVPELLRCRDLAPVLGLSCEPLLGPVKLDTLLHGGPPRWLTGEIDHGDPTIDWVIAGGESGPSARPMHPDWARSLRDQCAAAGVPFFFKQWGEWAPESQIGPIQTACDCVAMDQLGDEYSPGDFMAPEANVERLCRVGKKAAGRLLDGVTHDEYPRALTPNT